MRIAIFPGSFDPMTIGHYDLIRRAAALFDELLVAVAVDSGKAGRLPHPAREALVHRAVAGLPNVRVDRFAGLLADYAAGMGGQARSVVVVRGLRSAADFAYEAPMAQLNRGLGGAAETLFLVASPQYVHISSSRVREIAALGGDIAPLVPDRILEDIRAAYGRADR
jgi:pantetheine-phosphate adenylyltransferase